MVEKHDLGFIGELKERFSALGLFRPGRDARYDPGQELTYDIRGVERDNRATIRLRIEAFAGGGFAGQVYRVRLLEQGLQDGPVGGLKENRHYALKIFIPPSGLSRFFRNMVYRLGFQGPFPYQINPDAVRAGALWQKFIRRAARERLGEHHSVNDVHAVLIDHQLGSCGEISDWIDGRTWKLEVDDHLDYLKRFLAGKPVNSEKLGSPEYRSKKKFMADFVRMLHELGAVEFARQYEWWTCKSQPNCLKRLDSEERAEEGLVAVDFRAGLALLPFLPMSPVDFKLIARGIFRGRMVQFDRGNLDKLQRFLAEHPPVFKGMDRMLADLRRHEAVYRNSQPDVTRHHVKLLFSRRLWKTILNSSRVSWTIKNLIDEPFREKLDRSHFRTAIFYLLGVFPLLGRVIRKCWGHGGWRRHYGHMISSPAYLLKSVKGKCLEKGIHWVRSGRVAGDRILRVADSLSKSLVHFFLSIFPAGLHRFLSDATYFKARMRYIFIRPIKLYFNEAFREQWLMDMIEDGKRRQILNREDARLIQSQAKEPFIQKYLKSLAVHICTLPVTQVISVTVSGIYVMLHPELSAAQAMAAVAAILVLFQVTPVSPGSLVRGFYVLFLVVRERNFKDYNIAIFLSFFKYIGYLAFPIQMTYRYPALARFMAGYWSTEVVHHIPVFGEKGALLEHWVFNLFYNWPLTIRRRMRKTAQKRVQEKPRYWHVGPLALSGALLMGLGNFLFLKGTGFPPSFRDNWWLILLVPFLTGGALSRLSGGARLSARVISSVLCGVLTGMFYALASGLVRFSGFPGAGDLVRVGLWGMFGFSIFTVAGMLFAELRRPDPDLKKTGS